MALQLGSKGGGTVLGVGKESTLGTAVSASITLPVGEVKLDQVSRIDEAGDLWSGAGDVATELHELQRDVSGSMSLLLSYSGLGLLWEAFFGTISTGAESGGVYPHTYTLSRSASVPSLTLIEADKDPGGTDYLRTWAGVVCVDLEVSIPANQIGTVRASLAGVALDSYSSGTPDAPAAPSRVKANQLNTLTWNSVSYLSKTVSVKLKGTTGLQAQHVQGTLVASGFAPSGRRQLTAELTLLLTPAQTSTLQSGLSAGTQSDLVIKYAGPSSQDMQFTLHNAQLMSITKPASKFGARETTVMFKGTDDGSDRGLALLIHNANASHAS
jgi:hypothetical protein